MFEDHLRYDLLIDNAMRQVVKDVLEKVSKDGLPGEHHFLLSFATTYPGAVVPPRLLVKYPDEMTIVIQYQYEELEVNDKFFSLMLSFDGIKEKLVIPYDSLTSFADPGVKFGLKFNLADEATASADKPEGGQVINKEPVTKESEASPSENAGEKSPAGANNNVVSLNFSRDK